MPFNNEIEKTKKEIEVLTAKLTLLEEMEKTKTPVEEAFKRVYSYYPEGCETSVWVAFQKGYEQSQKDYKVGEFQETAQELKTLYQMLDDGKYYPDRRDNICNIVKEWIFQYDCDYATCKEYLEGYEECQTVLEERLK